MHIVVKTHIYVYIYICIYLHTYIFYLFFHLFLYSVDEGSLEVKFPAIWADGRAEVGRVREEKRRREMIRAEKEREERRRRCAKSGKVAIK